ncbi:FtsX-like permease family protein [uncultured Algibacter sp.]|uniref:ABC transporter permease n=1 Tax=uncultured Algibacter sp. TaxID=298659 RepID=UPI00262B351A|nr:FtsX-like permease family protein [uncultured Algibacter sp.]
MSFSLHIAKRYLRSKSTNNAINFITYIAIIGVILGSASLFIVLSGFAGLKEFTLQFSSEVDPDLKAETAIGKSFILTDAETNNLNNLEDIAYYSKIIEERIVIASEDKNTLAILKGVDKNFQNVVAIDSTLDHGSWLEQKSNQLVVGWGISNSLSLGVLNFIKPINISVPKPGKGQITSIKNAFNNVKAISVGVFYINEELNDSYVYAPIDLAKNLLNYKANQISSIEFKLKNDVDETQAIANIQAVLGNKVILKNRAQLNDALYKMLNTENLAVYLLLTLVSALLIFNVIGSIIMMILEKKQSLNTLFNLGFSIKNIRNIFFIQGSVITVIGCLTGLFLGLLIVALQKMFGIVPITPTLAYPMSIKLENLILVFLTISVLGIFSSKIASVRITKSLVQNI